MAPLQESHHHRNTTKTVHKVFKSRHATKNSIRNEAKGKLDKKATGERRTPHQQIMSKLDRKNQARQHRQAKHSENVKATSVFSGQKGAPRFVAIVSLSEGLDGQKAIENLNDAVDAHHRAGSPSAVRVDRFKQNLYYLPVKGELLNILDVCQMADYVIIVFPPTRNPGSEADLILRAIESQGVSNILTTVQNLNTIASIKEREQIIWSLKSHISRFFPHQDKIASLDNKSECANIVRSLCSGVPKGIRWRDDRSWMVVEDLRWSSGDASGLKMQSLVLTGYVRGKGIKPNRLVHIPDYGTCQIEKVTKASSLSAQTPSSDHMMVDQHSDTEEILGTPGNDQEDLSDLAPYDHAMDDSELPPAEDQSHERRGVLLDDHHYFSEDETHIPEAPKRLPKGTSSYQAAWFLGDMSDSGSEYEKIDDEGDLQMDNNAMPQDGVEGLDRRLLVEPTEASPSEYPQSEMFPDPSPDDEAAQLAEYRAQKKSAAEEDLEFPDEVELHPNVLARERLGRYRGLKSLKTSTWETSEDKVHEPEDWERLLPIPDYSKARRNAENDALVDGISPGTRVNLHLRIAPLSSTDSFKLENPLAVFSLLRHEQKKSVVNMSISLRSDHPHPLKSKCELVVQCGPRRFVINPIFSQSGNTPNNVHKFLRYLHPGQTAIASFIAPVTWGSVPVLYFQQSPSLPSSLEPIATGTSLPPSTSRVIAKRVILTGHPYKIHKKLVTVRYMFFNAEDINWFKALPLWTKRGRSGFIKESLGTHGYFKATFDARINPQDAVGVSLYKRVWPRQAKEWKSNVS